MTQTDEVTRGKRGATTPGQLYGPDESSHQNRRTTRRHPLYAGEC